MLLTWIVCLFLLWEALRSEVYLGIVQSQHEDHSKKLLRDKIKVAWELLPRWFKWVVTDGRMEEVIFTSTEARFPRGQSLLFVPQGAHQFRQHTPSAILVDEAAHQEKFGETLTAILPFLEKETKIFLVSSVTGGSVFSKILQDSRPEGDIKYLLRGHEDLPPEYRKGLQKWELNSGGVVIQPHFSIHPEKDNEWLERKDKEIPGGILSPFFRQEYNIEYGAFSGQHVWPHFINGPPHVEEFEPIEKQPQWLTADYGYRNPTAILRICRIGKNKHGHIYGVFRELRKTQTSISDLKMLMWNIFGKPEDYEAELIDPSTDWVREADTATHFHLFNSGSYARTFQKADNSSEGAILIGEWLHQNRLKIHPSCTDLIYEMQNYRHDDWVGSTEEKHSPKETVVKKDDHSVDALRYFANWAKYLENDEPSRGPDLIDRSHVDDFFQDIDNANRYMRHGVEEGSGPISILG
jgi:hypothetical protein